METQSRRHVIDVGKIDGNAPRVRAKEPGANRRAINDISDIKGSHPKDRGSYPKYIRNSSTQALGDIMTPIKGELARNDSQGPIEQPSVHNYQTENPYDNKS